MLWHPSDCFGSGHGQNRSDPLSSGKDAVPHGLVQYLRFRIIGRQEFIESLVHYLPPLYEIRLKLHDLLFRPGKRKPFHSRKQLLHFALGPVEDLE